ncbi:universal stress protein [Rhodococcus marinonascens]|uniref:universal stress protein n=1 Tax=Rhodococcus marinonascens TaxID=38311 RepID=UPI0009326627|nr:universal stress protein [Rhodococcus marinonascens]
MIAHRPILVGVDGSPPSLRAVVWAAQAAALRNSPLMMITTTFVPGAHGVPIGTPASFFEDEEHEGKNRLADAADVAAAAVPGYTLEIHPILGTGSPTGEILERSKSTAMVVVGSNRRGVIERGFLGSVSSAVLAHAECPVAVIRGNPDSDATRAEGPVVVGVDGTAHSVPAITVAFEEAALRGCELVAVHAWSDMKLSMAGGGGDESKLEQIVTRESALLSESLAGHAEPFPDVKVRTKVVKDRPARNLREESNGAQLLVVGSRGRGGFTSMLLGSTSRTLMHSVGCPLLVVR